MTSNWLNLKLKRHPLCFAIDRFTRSGSGFTTSNRLTADTGSINRTYSYDGTGNITGDGQDTYSYYNSGRLKQVTRGSTNIYALRYNGLGQFVQRTNGNLYYLYDEAGHLLGEYASTGNAEPR